MTQERAVTMADYVRVTDMNAQVAKRRSHAALDGKLVHRLHHRGAQGRRRSLTAPLRKQLKRNVNRYRLAGQDIELEPPQYVSLADRPHHLRRPRTTSAPMSRRAQQVLGCGILSDGTRRFRSRQLHLRPDGLSEPDLRSGAQGRRRQSVALPFSSRKARRPTDLSGTTARSRSGRFRSRGWTTIPASPITAS